MLFGYAYFTVLTSSMQEEIPKGSLILVREVDTMNININDNITYMNSATSTITHKVVDIFENYENSGSRGFQTRGINNENADRNIVYAANVVGKVILIVPVAGAVISYLVENVYLVFIIFGLIMVLSFSLRGLFSKSARKQAAAMKAKA